MTERDREIKRLDLEDLLLKAVVEPLDAQEQAYLAELEAKFPEVDANVFERTAAAVMLAALAPVEPIPEKLKDEILAAALSGAAGPE
jgi:hypothetical protein